MINIETPLSGKLIGSRELSSKYYSKIDRTSDLLLGGGRTLTTKGNSLILPNYYIAPSTVRFDTMVDEALYELNKAISAKMILPSGEQIISHSINEVLEGAAAAIKGGVTDSFQNYLQKAGYSGVLIKIASDINASRVDSFIRQALSNLGIFFYLAYRTMEGYEIKDASGVASHMMASIGLVQSYVNAALVDKVIKSKNLNATAIEVDRIKRYFDNREIDYSPGKPEEIIEDFFVSLKEGGSLFGLVRNFVNSDKVKLPTDVNRDELIKKMVNYLLDIGYVYETNAGADPDLGKVLDGIGGGNSTLPADDFSGAIEGVGPAIEKRFLDAGIRRFVHLASLDNDKLRAKLNDKGITDYTEIIEQAQLIAASKFEELIALQKKLK